MAAISDAWITADISLGNPAASVQLWASDLAE
jgi:hypothetical protein